MVSPSTPFYDLSGLAPPRHRFRAHVCGAWSVVVFVFLLLVGTAMVAIPAVLCLLSMEFKWDRRRRSQVEGWLSPAPPRRSTLPWKPATTRR